MQLIPRYLYNNRIDVVSNDVGFVVEYRPVYSRQIKVYKGVDNRIQFRMLNADQKPIDISGHVIEFQAFDDEKNQVLKYDATIQDDGSTASTKGMFYVTVTENDLLNLPAQYLSYTVFDMQACDQKVVTYANGHFGACGTIYIDDCTSPTILPSLEVTNWLEVNEDTTVWVAGNDELTKICAQPKINKNEALHTVQFYTDAYNSNGYVGNVKIQGTLDNQIDDQTNWFDVKTVEFVGTEERPVMTSFNGVYSYLRFEADADPADRLLKVLIRN
jgi:hypothetical protein